MKSTVTFQGQTFRLANPGEIYIDDRDNIYISLKNQEIIKKPLISDKLGGAIISSIGKMAEMAEKKSAREYREFTEREAMRIAHEEKEIMKDYSRLKDHLGIYKAAVAALSTGVVYLLWQLL